MRRRGFTLIELLVVIAIIGILAAMLFPVFARARESARKTQCLANVKNLAIAINMYMTDYDKFPPGEHRSEVLDFFVDVPGTGDVGNCNTGGDYDEAQWAADVANPYLQWPVLLDDYVKNRDVWKCPSAKMEAQATFIYNDGGNWLKYLQDNVANLGVDGIGPNCTHMPFPAGWGGEVTDSFLQHMLGGSDAGNVPQHAQGVFVQSIGAAKENLQDVSFSSIQDSAKLIVFADQPPSNDWLSIGRIAYSNICCAECSGVIWTQFGSIDCPDGSWCDATCFDNHAHSAWAADQAVQKNSTRHLGGSNVGFGDGHAKWYAARAIVAASDEGGIEGVGNVCPSSLGTWNAWGCGSVPAGVIFFHNADVQWDGKLR